MASKNSITVIITSVDRVAQRSVEIHVHTGTVDSHTNIGRMLMSQESHINIEEGLQLKKLASDDEDTLPWGEPESIAVEAVKEVAVEAVKEAHEAVQDWMSEISTIAPDTPRSVASSVATGSVAGGDMEEEILKMEKELVELALEKAGTEQDTTLESGEGKEPPAKGIDRDTTLEDAAKNGFVFDAKSAMGARFKRWIANQDQETKDKYEAVRLSRPRLQKFKRDWAQGVWEEYTCKKSFVEETVELTNGASGKTNPTGQPNLKTQTDIIWFFKYTLSC